MIDYQKEDFTRQEEPYDFVFDAVGKSSFSKCKPLLKPGGIYISSELGPNAENLYLPLLTKIRGGKKVIFPIPICWLYVQVCLKGIGSKNKATSRLRKYLFGFPQIIQIVNRVFEPVPDFLDDLIKIGPGDGCRYP